MNQATTFPETNKLCRNNSTTPKTLWKDSDRSLLPLYNPVTNHSQINTNPYLRFLLLSSVKISVFFLPPSHPHQFMLSSVLATRRDNPGTFFECFVDFHKTMLLSKKYAILVWYGRCFQCSVFKKLNPCYIRKSLICGTCKRISDANMVRKIFKTIKSLGLTVNTPQYEVEFLLDPFWEDRLCGKKTCRFRKCKSCFLIRTCLINVGVRRFTTSYIRKSFPLEHEQILKLKTLVVSFIRHWTRVKFVENLHFPPHKYCNQLVTKPFLTGFSKILVLYKLVPPSLLDCVPQSCHIFIFSLFLHCLLAPLSGQSLRTSDILSVTCSSERFLALQYFHMCDIFPPQANFLFHLFLMARILVSSTKTIYCMDIIIKVTSTVSERNARRVSLATFFEEIHHICPPLLNHG